MRRFYWIRQGVGHGAVLLVASMLYCVFMATADDFGRSFQEYLKLASMYLTGMAVFMPVIFNMGSYAVTLPLTLSLGATRKEGWIGLQLYRLAMILPVMGSLALIAVLRATSDFWLFFVILLSGYLVFSGIGGLMGILTTKLSRGSLVAAVAAISIGAVAVTVVVGVVIAVVSKVVPALIAIAPFLAALVYAFCTCHERKAILALYVK